MYWEPSTGAFGDIPEVDVFHEPADIDEFLELAERLEGRRRAGQPSTKDRSNDHKPPPPPKIDLVLYTSPASEKSQRAVRAVQEVLARYVASQVNFRTCDLSVRPQDGELDAVVFTPTLVKQGPGPRTSIIGNLDKAEILCELLDASGVDRRRWDD
jgi:hypothetical protein